MNPETDRHRRLAVLIDADNASPRIADSLFEEIASIGEASVRRIYGDFSTPHLKGWAAILANHAIVPQQNFANTVGKNASDIALVIDAMDLLHTGRFDGFCLVSSDGDFTRLASRIREQGMDVFGFGEHKTPESFRRSCKRFIYTENLVVPKPADAVAAEEAQIEAPTAKASKQHPSTSVPLIRNAMAQMDDLDGWFHLAGLGKRLFALAPDFDPRSYGCAKLTSLVEQTGAFDLRRDNLTVMIRPRDGNPARKA